MLGGRDSKNMERGRPPKVLSAYNFFFHEVFSKIMEDEMIK
jgi:hypothetical protein